MAFDNTFQNNMNTVYLHSSEDRDGRHHNKARRISSYSDATSRSVVQPEDAAEHFHFSNLAASAFVADPFWSAPFDAKESASPASPVSSVSSGHSTDSDDSESTEFHQPQVPADISFDLSFSVSSPEQSYDDISSLNFFSNPLSGFGLPAEPLFQNDVLAYPIRIADPDPALLAPGAISAPLPLPSFQPQPQIAPLPMILPLPGAPSNVAMEATSDGSDSEFESETEVEVEEVVEGPAELKLLPASCAASFGHKDGTNGNLLTIREDRSCLLAIYHPEAQRHCAARGTFEVIFRIPDDTRSVVVSGKKMQENGVKIQVPRLAPRLVRKCPRYPDSSDLYTVEIRFGNCQLFFPIKSRVKN